MTDRIISAEAKEQLSSTGAAISQAPSGLPKKRYYTPDGREVWKIAQQRERGIYSTTEKDKDGKPRLLGTESYDIFFAQGYLPTKPENPKPYCKGCDKWHDSQEEVKACIAERQKFYKTMEKRAAKEVGESIAEKDNKIARLQEDVNKLTKLVEQLVNKENSG